jgi:dTDP-4-amino-4,6-dideoxygalactose transaminase
MQVPYLDISAEIQPLKAKILERLALVLDRGQFILGSEVSQFEKNIAEKFSFPFVAGVNSGADALYLAMRLCDIGPNDEVITVSNSFFATANAISLTGARPIFVDINDDLLMDPKLIEAQISPRTKAILPVHLTGKSCAMNEILSIAKKYQLKVIEDAAQAIGAKYQNQFVGSFGIGCFSLHPLKNLAACGDGGFITLNDRSLYERLLKLRNHGLKDRDHLDLIGMNSRLDELQAAILNVKLQVIDEITAKRRRNAELYRQALESELGKGVLSLPRENSSEFCVYHTYVIRVERRAELQSFLAKNGIDTKIHYPSPIHLQPAYRTSSPSLPKTEAYAEQILSLPVHQSLDENQIQFVAENLRNFFRKAL